MIIIINIIAIIIIIMVIYNCSITKTKNFSLNVRFKYNDYCKIMYGLSTMK